MDQDDSVSHSWRWVNYCRRSKHILLATIVVTLLLDFLLLTTIVSIMPEYLYNLAHPDHPLGEDDNIELISSNTPVMNTTQLSGNIEWESNSSTNASEIQTYDLSHETIIVGLMFAAKPFFQLIANPFVGPLTHMIGYSIPMLIGLIILLTTTLAFAFGDTYAVLFTARSVQGIGSSFTTVAGLGLLAEKFSDEKERGTAISIAFSGICLGSMLGPALGGAMYQFIGYSSPFLLIFGLMLCNAALLIVALPPKIILPSIEAPSLKTLISDPYILTAAGIITVGNLGLSLMEPSLPIWMINRMGAERWQQGAIFLSSSVAYLIGGTIIGRLGHIFGRWRVAIVGLIIIGICLVAIPFTTTMEILLIPNAGVGWAVGMVENSMFPELAHLVEIRHAPVYGTVYAIGNFAISVSYVTGPVLSAVLVNHIGFDKTLFGLAVIGVAFSPLLILLKNPPTKEEMKSLVLKKDPTPQPQQDTETK